MLIANVNAGIKIGSDCLFAGNIQIRSGNGHTIFDVEAQKVLTEGSTDIQIGNHVWIGNSVKVMDSVHIGDGSVIGIDSVVTRSFENNKLIVGSPAKVLRENIVWDNEDGLTWDDFEQRQLYKKY